MGNGLSVIGIARESKSPENPSETQKFTDCRLALLPPEIGRLITAGCTVMVEQGAGQGLGLNREDFEAVGASLVCTQQVFADSDMVLKLKGPSLEHIQMMTKGASMGCFAHLETFPERRKTFQQCGINVIALEEILDSPERIPEAVAFGRGLANDVIPSLAQGQIGNLEVVLAGFSDELYSIAQQSSRMGARVSFIGLNVSQAALQMTADRTVVIHDSSISGLSRDTALAIEQNRATSINLSSYSSATRNKMIADYIMQHPPRDFGRRKIEFLKETGICGMRYGLELLKDRSPLRLDTKSTNVIVLGYGNVAKGAIVEALKQGVQRVQVLGRGQIDSRSIVPYLKSADLIINGIDLGDEKGQRYLVTKEHVSNNLVREGAVIIDLVGGSKLERSAIENILSCTFLEEPYRIENGVFFSALWGWPMMYMMRESCTTYSKQIADLLLGEERVLGGLDDLSPGVNRAITRAGQKHERCNPVLLTGQDDLEV